MSVLTSVAFNTMMFLLMCGWTILWSARDLWYLNTLLSFQRLDLSGAGISDVAACDCKRGSVHYACSRISRLLLKESGLTAIMPDVLICDLRIGCRGGGLQALQPLFKRLCEQAPTTESTEAPVENRTLVSLRLD